MAMNVAGEMWRRWRSTGARTSTCRTSWNVTGLRCAPSSTARCTSTAARWTTSVRAIPCPCSGCVMLVILVLPTYAARHSLPLALAVARARGCATDSLPRRPFVPAQSPRSSRSKRSDKPILTHLRSAARSDLNNGLQSPNTERRFPNTEWRSGPILLHCS